MIRRLLFALRRALGFTVLPPRRRATVTPMPAGSLLARSAALTGWMRVRP